MYKKFKFLSVLCIIALFCNMFGGVTSASSDDTDIILDSNSGHFPSFQSASPSRVIDINGTYYIAYNYHPNNTFVNSLNGYVRIKKSTDKGKTWTSFYSGTQEALYAPSLAKDNNGNILVYFMYYIPASGTLRGHFMRFDNGNSTPAVNTDLDMTLDGGVVGDKYSFAYDPVHNVMYASGRSADHEMFVREYLTDGTLRNEYILTTEYGSYIQAGGIYDEHIDGEYQGLYVDSTGRLHIIYNAVYRQWFGESGAVAAYNWIKARYMYCDWDSGNNRRGAWKRVDGTTVTTPYKASNFVDGGTPISSGPSYAGISSILAVGNYVHILDTNGAYYTRLNLSTGSVERKVTLQDVSSYSTLVEGSTQGTLYIFTACGNKPALLSSKDNGDTWTMSSQLERSPRMGHYAHAAAMQKVTADGYVIGLISDYAVPDTGPISDAVFVSYKVDGKSDYYRLEQTASGTTAVTDNALLNLDGANQVKDSTGTAHGNAVCYNGTTHGSYQSVDGSVTPVSAAEIRGAASNSYFGKLSSYYQQGVNLGDLDVGTGLTLEGWFYPTGNGVYLVSKRTGAAQAGTYALWINANNALNFTMQDGSGTYTWVGSNNAIQLNQWNYVAVTWVKNSRDVQFYVKKPGNTITGETVTIAGTPSGFPNTSDMVSIGYSAGWQGGYDGYFDEVRVSEFARTKNELLAADNVTVQRSSHYKLEQTAAGGTPTDDSSLGTGGGLKDESGTNRGTPLSFDGAHLGSYQSSDGAVSPVPYSEIKGATANSFFGKLTYTSYSERVNLGVHTVGEGLTLEGWFYLSGNRADAVKKANLFYKTGYWMNVNSSGQLEFVAGGGTWTSSSNSFKWNQWNYVAVTWHKNSKTVDFYVKPLGEKLQREEVLTNVRGPLSYFDYAGADTYIGHRTANAYGMEGYFDEVRISNFKRSSENLLVKDHGYYRLEQTASGTTAVTDNALLNLDGANQVKDEAGAANGNAVCSNGTNHGSYQSVDGSVTPVPVTEIKGISSNNYFGKLSSYYQQGVNLGDLDAGSGLTLEGWFYPTANGVFLVSKRSGAAQAGTYGLWINGNNGLNFNMQDSSGAYAWASSNNMVQLNQWNYIALTWVKNSRDVQFYVKRPGGTMAGETVTNAGTPSGFPNTSDMVSIGYSAGWQGGYDGYFDEVRVSDFARTKNELLASDSSYYRMETTASDNTQVTDGQSLRLDGSSQIRDENRLYTGNPTSLDGTNFGKYESLDDTVVAVPSTEIKGNPANIFFGKLNYSNREGIVLGDLDAGNGLTLEGWFYPTGDKASADSNARLITKQTSQQGGNYSLWMNANGGLSFSMRDSGGTLVTWTSNNNVVQWNKWNYVGVTWSRSAQNTVNFYVKQTDKKVVSQSVNQTMGTFPNSSDSVTIGYNSGISKGFQGYFDEVRITNYARPSSDLLYADSNYYRLESRVDGTVPANGNSLASGGTDGSYQIKDDAGSVSGNAKLSGNTTYGTYQTSDGSVVPVPYTNIKGASSNSLFGKLSHTAKEGIDLGDLDVGTGLTLEGWFCPTGTKSSAYYNGVLIVKDTNYRKGNYWLRLNETGGVVFGVYDGDTTQSQWISADGLVKWNQWNYIAVTWQRDSAKATFYVKPLGDSTIVDTKMNYNVIPGFPNTDDKVTIGYNANWDRGFQGYFDEVRISGFARTREQLHMAEQWYYRFEKSSSGVTGVADNASLKLGTTDLVKDEYGAAHGAVSSFDNVNFGTYQSIDGTVTPVSFTEIKDIYINNASVDKDAESNSFFAKLSKTNRESINLGDLDAGKGLTIEGWFRPTGNQADAYYNARMVTKNTSYKAGNYWMYADSNGSVRFGIVDNTTWREWVSKPGLVQWNQWNYIGVTWRKNFKDVEFYVKQPGGSLKYDVVSIAAVDTFPNSNDSVTIGYNDMFSGGFDGYVDEVRISDRRLNIWELLVR